MAATKKGRYTLAEQRSIALSAACGYLREHGQDLQSASLMDLERALDDLGHVDSQLIAVVWYKNASDNQWRLFSREVRKILRNRNA